MSRDRQTYTKFSLAKELLEKLGESINLSSDKILYILDKLATRKELKALPLEKRIRVLQILTSNMDVMARLTQLLSGAPDSRSELNLLPEDFVKFASEIVKDEVRKKNDEVRKKNERRIKGELEI